MTDDKEKVIDLIRKCLRLSESPNENEAQVALEKAQELLEKYNLTMGEVKTDEVSNNAPELVNEEIGLYANWQGHLVGVIATHNFCKVVLNGRMGIFLLGRAPNVAAVTEMSSWIIQQLDRMANDSAQQSEFTRGAYLDPVTNTFVRTHKEAKQTYRAAFIAGATKRINERLTKSREQRVEADSNMRALVVNLSGELRTFINLQFPSLCKVYNKVNRYSNGYGAGYDAGNKISLIRPSHHIEGSGKYLGSGR